MNTSQPFIKIIPPNPLSHSILIVYCYTNNKTIQCQAKWSRIQPNQQNLQFKNNRSANTQTGNTYKCSPLDCNHSILVQATCQVMGQTYKLIAKTQPVKPSKQLLQKKVYQKTANSKIINSNLEIQCQISFQSNKTLQITCGSKIFNLELQSSHVYILSQNSFKARILSHRYEFLTFFHQCQDQKKVPTHNFQLSLANLFQFDFSSESDRDLVLLKISQNTIKINEKIYNFTSIRPKMISSHQQLPVNNNSFLENAKINVELKTRDHHFQSVDKKHQNTKRSDTNKSLLQTNKKDFKLNQQAQQNKSQNLFFYYSSKPKQKQRKQNGSETKKNQKIKISQKLTQKSHKGSSHDINSKSHHDLKTRLQLPHNEVEKTASILNEKKKNRKKNKQFLNIFDEEGVDSDSQVILQNSSPEFFQQGPLKNRSLTSFVENKTSSLKKDLPSMNLRSSFDELQNAIDPLKNQKINQKLKTQTCRQLSYQAPKSKQKSDALDTPSNQTTQIYNEDSIRRSINLLKKENEELKKQNSKLKRQIQSFQSRQKQYSNMKKKFYQLTQAITSLEKQKKQILLEKLTYQTSFHREKSQKESLKRQIQDIFCLIKKNSFQQLIKLARQKKQKQTLTFEDQMFNKVGCQTLKNLSNPKKYILNEGRNKTPPGKITSENHSLLIEQKKGLTFSNSKSRKQLPFPNNSYKYPPSNKNTTVL